MTHTTHHKTHRKHDEKEEGKTDHPKDSNTAVLDRPGDHASEYEPDFVGQAPPENESVSEKIVRMAADFMELGDRRARSDIEADIMIGTSSHVQLALIRAIISHLDGKETRIGPAHHDKHKRHKPDRE